MTEFIPRRAARVLLVDDAERVLLFHGWDPAHPERGAWWFTPGGGLEPGEAPAAGAARELAEETGLRVHPDDLGGPVWHEVTEFSFGDRWFRQSQEFFLLRVPDWRVDTTGFDEVERGSIDEHRWWSAGDLRRTSEVFYPIGLPTVLHRVLNGEPAC